MNSSHHHNQSPQLAKGGGAEWQVIAAFDKLMAEKETQRQKDKQAQAKQDFRRTLDDHVLLAQELKKGDNRDEIEYTAHVNLDVQKFRVDEERKQAEVKRRNLELLQIRQEQCEDQQRRKQDEQRKSEDFARNMVRTAHERLAIEKEIQEEARRKVREMRMKIEEDNVHNKKVLQESHVKEREEDQRLMAEYAAKLDKEAYERDHAFKKRMAHIDKTALQFALEGGAGKIAQDEQLQREATLMKELLLAEERETAEVQRKERDKKLRLQKMLAGNQELILTREQEKRDEMQLRIRLARQYKEEEENVRQEEKLVRQKRLNEQQTYNNILRQQIDDRDAGKIQRDEMVGCERALNKVKLTQALANNDVIQEVLNGKVASNNMVRSMGPL